jgi:hypothetical protein
VTRGNRAFDDFDEAGVFELLLVAGAVAVAGAVQGVEKQARLPGKGEGLERARARRNLGTAVCPFCGPRRFALRLVARVALRLPRQDLRP